MEGLSSAVFFFLFWIISKPGVTTVYYFRCFLSFEQNSKVLNFEYISISVSELYSDQFSRSRVIFRCFYLHAINILYILRAVLDGLTIIS